MINDKSGIRYSENTQNYNSSNSNIRVPRGWLIFAQVFGTVSSVIGLLVFIRFMPNMSIVKDNVANKSIIALLLAIIVYFVWRSIYTALIIVQWARKASDDELSANRYIISALSLSVGGFFTPFLVTGFSNVATKSTIKPRYFLSKVMGLCILIGAPILLIVYLLTLVTGANAVNAKLIFDTSSTVGIISIVVLMISCVAFIFGLITTNLFFKNKASDDFANNKPSKLLKMISTIWMAILTIELAIVILFAILRLIGALIEFFRMGEEGRGFLMMFFALLNLLVTISYVGMVIYVTTRTMAGLWSIDGTITIRKYEHSQLAKSRLSSYNVNA